VACVPHEDHRLKYGAPREGARPPYLIIILIMLREASLAALALVSAGVLIACGSDSDGDGGTRVVATTGIIAEVAGRVAGEDAEVTQLVPDGASPHDFELSAEDRQALEEADLIAYNGAGLEVGIPVDEADAPKWALAENAGELLPFEGGGEDPHVWMDPTRTADALDSLAAALSEADPGNADAYRRRARDYDAALRDLDRELDDTLAAVRRDERELVTSHDSLEYFADRYGFEVVATPFPASGAEAEASPVQLAEVVDAIEEYRVPAVFAGEEDDPEVLEQVADETGAEVVPDLLVESTGDAGSYDEMLRRDAELISGALATTGEAG
jgi:zinc/manganese transport system substrate-binding protein